jgi:hypothetical protein
MDEIKLLEYRLKNLEKTTINIIRDLNYRINDIENKMYEVQKNETKRSKENSRGKKETVSKI